MDLQQRSDDIAREIVLRGLTEPVHVVSLEIRKTHQLGGRICIVQPRMAARLIVDGTHRYATPDEAAEFVLSEALKSRAINEETLAAKQRFQINISPEMVALAASAQQPNKAQRSKE